MTRSLSYQNVQLQVVPHWTLIFTNSIGTKDKTILNHQYSNHVEHYPAILLGQLKLPPFKVHFPDIPTKKRWRCLDCCMKTVFTLTSVCIISLLVPIEFLRCWRGELVLTFLGFLIWWTFPSFSWPSCVIQRMIL